MQSYVCWSVRMRQKSCSSSQTRSRVPSSVFQIRPSDRSPKLSPETIHTALRAPPWAFTHHTHRQHLRALLTRGIGILALSPRRDQRVGGRRSRRWIPPTQKPTHRVLTCTNAARHLWPVASVLLTLCTLSAPAPVEGGRVGNLWAAAALPPSDKSRDHECDCPNPTATASATPPFSVTGLHTLITPLGPGSAPKIRCVL